MGRRAGRLIGRFFLAAMVIFCFFTPVWAAQSLYVGPGESIQEAINNAQPGDTIVVGPGTYSETVTIDKEDIHVVAESIHEATLFGSFIVKAKGVKIDGFYVDGASDSDWVGVDIHAADVSVTNTIIETTGDELVRGLEIKSDDPGVWEFQGSMDLDTRKWYSTGVYAELKDDTKIVIDGAMNVTAQERSATGVSVQANDDLDISLKDVTVTADLSADGVFISGRTGYGWWSNGWGTTLLVDGDVTVLSEWSGATGVSITRDYNTTATVTGNITVNGWDAVWGVSITGFSDVSFSSGDVTVTGVEDAHGVQFGDEDYGGGLGDRAVLTVGNVVVEATANDSEADGLLIAQDDVNSNEMTVTAKNVVVRGGKRAQGIDLLGGGDVVLHVDGLLDVSANQDAYGMNVKSGNNLSLTVTESTTVTGRNASAVKVNTMHGANIALGDVKVEGVASAIGADLSLGLNASVNIGGSFDVSATGSNANATALHLTALNNAYVRVEGDVAVETKRNATGVWTDLRENGTVMVEGLVAVTSENALAEGVVVKSQKDLTVSTKAAQVTGANARGVFVDVGNYSGAALTVDGEVKVTGASGNHWAEGVKMEGGNDLSLTITGDVDVTGGRDVVGVWIEGNEKVTATLAGVQAKGGGEKRVNAVQFNALSDATLTMVGDAAAIGHAADSWAYGVNVAAVDNLTVSAKSVTATGGLSAIAVNIGGFSTSSAGDDVTLTIDGDLTATVHGGGTDASGIDLISGDNLSVFVAGNIEASGGGVGVGARFETLDGAEISLGDVSAEGYLDAYGVVLEAGDGAALTVGAVFASADAQSGWTAVGLELSVGDESRIEVERIEVKAPYDADGMKLLSGGSAMTIDVVGGFDVSSDAPIGTAVGLWLNDFDSLVLTLDGVSSVQAVDSATGVDVGANESGREITLLNLGELRVSGSDAAGIRLDVEERAIVENKGVIVAERSTGGGIAVDARASAATELLNEGVIVGDILLGARNDLVVIGSTGRVDGDVDLGDGDDTAIVYAGAALRMLDGGGGSDTLRLLDAADPATLFALGMRPLAAEAVSEVTVRNFETVAIEGGRWSFGEGSDVATVEMTGGTVGGNSAFSGSLRNISGTVAPGNSFGIVTIAGDYFQGEEAILSIEVRPASDPKPGVDHDQLVVGGTARFEAGTTVQVLPLPGAWARTTRYVIVDGELEDFDPDAVNLDFPELLLLKGSLEEGSLVLLVESLSLASIAQSALQKGVAAALDKAAEDSGPGLHDLYGWFSQLSLDQQSEALKALDSISGGAYGYLPEMVARSADRIGEAVVRGVSGSLAETRRQVWAAGYSDSGKLTQKSHTPGASLDTRGFVTGADLISGPRLRIGIAAGGGTEALSLADPEIGVRGDSRRLGAYGRFEFGEARLALFAGYGITGYASERAVVYGGVAHRAKARFDAGSALLWAEAGYEPVQWGGLTIEPVASMGWLSVNQSRIKEEGAGDLSLTVEPFSTQRLVGRIGVQLEMKPIWAGAGTVTPRAKFAWTNDFAQSPSDQTARLAGAADSPFGIPISLSPASGFEASLGVSGTIGRNVTWNLDYTGEFQDAGRRDRVQGQVQFAF